MVPFFTALWIVIFQGNFDTTVTSVLLAISLSGFRQGDSPSGLKQPITTVSCGVTHVFDLSDIHFTQVSRTHSAGDCVTAVVFSVAIKPKRNFG